MQIQKINSLSFNPVKFTNNTISCQADELSYEQLTQQEFEKRKALHQNALALIDIGSKNLYRPFIQDGIEVSFQFKNSIPVYMKEKDKQGNLIRRTKLTPALKWAKLLPQSIEEFDKKGEKTKVYNYINGSYALIGARKTLDGTYYADKKIDFSPDFKNSTVTDNYNKSIHTNPSIMAGINNPYRKIKAIKRIANTALEQMPAILDKSEEKKEEGRFYLDKSKKLYSRFEQLMELSKNVEDGYPKTIKTEDADITFEFHNGKTLGSIIESKNGDILRKTIFAKGITTIEDMESTDKSSVYIYNNSLLQNCFPNADKHFKSIEYHKSYTYSPNGTLIEYKDDTQSQTQKVHGDIFVFDDMGNLKIHHSKTRLNDEQNIYSDSFYMTEGKLDTLQRRTTTLKNKVLEEFSFYPDNKIQSYSLKTLSAPKGIRKSSESIIFNQNGEVAKYLSAVLNNNI